jgi:hypothetical protein
MNGTIASPADRNATAESVELNKQTAEAVHLLSLQANGKCLASANGWGSDDQIHMTRQITPLWTQAGAKVSTSVAMTLAEYI